ncbi:MAG: gliding motility-associated C-terminal domain-containing protein [Bacteroidales bacterium]|nr:gliding motility-associated C-terminal domain-containing protein [Bacteroidales bacterium]
MNKRFLYILFTILLIFKVSVNGQSDTIPPVSPVLDLVTVIHSTGDVEMFWTPSSSEDVIGYVIYLYRDNAGHAIDTIFDPSATYYLRTGSGTSFYSESFVIAALDSGNTSPLSNALSTIFAETVTDTCNNKIEISWNSYTPYPKQVTGYSIFLSADGQDFIEAGTATADDNNFIFTDFLTETEYCFIVKAELEGAYVSGSNKSCVYTKMQRLPEWINADYATVNPDNSIDLSFTVDPDSEIKTLQLEKKTGSSGSYQWIGQIPPSAGAQKYTDYSADISTINYYRASVLNACGNPMVYSNICSNIVLTSSMEGNNIVLKWNSYRKWEGSVKNYKIFIDTGYGWIEKFTASRDDTIFLISYNDLMYDISGNEVCFMVRAEEGSNPFGVLGESQSSPVCVPANEKITVPNIFTPDNNSVNDRFRPVLSFTPVDYHLVITDLKRVTLFETRDFTSEWDGTRGADRLPQGTYLWFLRVRTPSGRNISETGTVTIVNNP